VRTRAWFRTLVLCAIPTFGALAPAPARAQAAAATPAPEAVEKAQALFKKGAGLYAAKKYALALAEFRASYAAVASPNSRLFVARCLSDLGEHVDAYLEFDAVAEEAAARAASEPRYVKTQETAQSERDDLAKKIALVTVAVGHPEAATSLRVGGKDVPHKGWGKPFPAKPGQVEVVLTSTAGAPATETLTLVAGEKKDVALDAASASSAGPVGGGVELGPSDGSPSSRAGLRPYAYIAGGVGLAGFALFTVTGIMANSTYSDLSSSCSGPCPPERADDIDAGKTQQTLANIGLVVGAVGIAAGATLFVLSVTGDDASEQQGSTPTRLVVGPGYAGLHGTF
jgi:hypothetical protein